MNLEVNSGDSGSNLGISLSFGQKQLLCVARVLLGSPKLVLLDEASSSLDIMTEVSNNVILFTLIRSLFYPPLTNTYQKIAPL